jgi:hypothetical protein
MSTALEELKLLLLQDDWADNRDAMIDALQLLLGVAEMKANSINGLMLANLENHLQSESVSFEDFHSCNSGRLPIAFSDSEGDEDDGRSSEEDKMTEISLYFTADENYDVSV